MYRCIDVKMYSIRSGPWPERDSNIDIIVTTMPSQKTFKTKRRLAKKQRQNRPIPQWLRLRTGNTIRYVSLSLFILIRAVELSVFVVEREIFVGRKKRRVIEKLILWTHT